MHDSYDSAAAHGAIVNAVLTQEVNEAPALHRIVHGYVPNTASLLHAIECFEELPNMVFLTRLFESSGLFHPASFVS